MPLRGSPASPGSHSVWGGVLEVGVDEWGSAWREWLLFKQKIRACGEGKVFYFGLQETWVEAAGPMQEGLWPKGYAVFQIPQQGWSHSVVLWASWATSSRWVHQPWLGSTQVAVSLRGYCFPAGFCILFYFH